MGNSIIEIGNQTARPLSSKEERGLDCTAVYVALRAEDFEAALLRIRMTVHSDR
jgi:hypothetical protein